MRVLITGITGFAGSHLAERLVERGDEVHGVAHEPPPLPNLARVVDRVVIHSGNILDGAALRAIVRDVRPEAVFHLAGLAVPTLAAADPEAAVRLNLLGTAHVAAASVAADAHLIVASSADVYGLPGPTPVDEDAPVHPANVYAATKVAAEVVVRGIARATVLRPCNQIGPRQHPGLAASEFARRIAEAEAGVAEPVIHHGPLEPRRQFLDVRDMAAAYEAALSLSGDGAVFNVANGAPVAVGRLLEMLVSLARVPMRTELDPKRVRPGVPPVLELDDSRFRRATGWVARIPLERSLSDTLDHWRLAVSQGLVGSR